MSHSNPYRGITVPIITPLTDRDTLDRPGLARLIEHILGGGVHGIFVLGTTGEGPSLSRRLQYEMIEQTCVLARGRVPVMVGVTHTSAAETIATAEVAAALGASTLVLSAPYYFPLSQSELLRYAQQLIPELPLPVFLYNMPSCTKLAFEPDTVKYLLDLPNLIGLKDSSGDMSYFHRILGITAERNDFSVFMGPELLLGESLLAGGHGGVTGGANLAPQLFVGIYQAVMAGDWEQVALLQKEVVRLQETIYSVAHHDSSFLRGVKCALSCLGICDDFLAPPLYRLKPKQREKVKQYLELLDLRANLSTSEKPLRRVI